MLNCFKHYCNGFLPFEQNHFFLYFPTYSQACLRTFLRILDIFNLFKDSKSSSYISIYYTWVRIKFRSRFTRWLLLQFLEVLRKKYYCVWSHKFIVKITLKLVVGHVQIRLVHLGTTKNFQKVIFVNNLAKYRYKKFISTEYFGLVSVDPLMPSLSRKTVKWPKIMNNVTFCYKVN